MINLTKNLVFLATVVILSPVALLAFVIGMVIIGIRVGLKCADDFMPWITR